MTSKIDQIQDRSDKYRQRKLFIENIRHKVGEQVFDSESRKRYWMRLAAFSFFGFGLIALSILSFEYTYPLNEWIGIFSSLVLAVMAVYSIGNSRVCGACEGSVTNRFPIYCVDCGQTYLMHKTGREAFRQRRLRMAGEVQAIINKYDQEHKHELESLKKAEEQ